MERLIIHISCSNSEAYRKLEKLCSKYGESMFIDFEQSHHSWVHEQALHIKPNKPDPSPVGDPTCSFCGGTHFLFECPIK